MNCQETNTISNAEGKNNTSVAYINIYGKVYIADACAKSSHLSDSVHAVVYVTNIKQGGLPVIAAFDMNANFDGDDVHKATSIHLQVDMQTMLENLPESATVYIQKNELDSVGATNNLRGLAAKIKFIGNNVSQNGNGVKGDYSL